MLPTILHAWVEHRLSAVTSPDAARAVFAEARERETVADRITSSDSQHTGAMVALMLAPDAARALAIPGGEPAADMHITLAYLGEAADWTDAQRARLSACLARFASTHHLPAGESGTLGQFPVGEENKYPIYASVNIPGIQAFRAQLVADLTRDGLPYDTTHANYVPHITLTYLDEGAKAPSVQSSSVALHFDAITLAMAGERTAFPLQREERAVEGDPLDRLITALASRVEATALSDYRSSLADLKARVSQALPY